MTEDASPSYRVAKWTMFQSAEGAASSVLVIFYSIGVARTLPVEDFGRISSIGLIAALLSVIFVPPLHRALAMFMADYIGRGEFKTARGAYWKVMKIGMVFSGTAGISCYMVSDIFSSLFIGDASYSYLIRLLAIYTSIVVYASFQVGGLTGLGHFKQIAKYTVTGEAVKTSLALLFLFLGFGLSGILIGWIIGALVGTLLGLIHLRNCMGGTSASQPLKPLLNYSLPLYGSNLLQHFGQSLERYVLVLDVNLFSFALYSIALTASGFLNGCLRFPLENSLFRQFSEMSRKLKPDEFKHVIARSTKYVSLITLPLYLGLAAVSEGAVTLLFGDKYSGAAMLMAILLMLEGFTFGTTVVKSVIESTAKTRISLEMTTISVVVSIVLSVLLIPSLGGIGAAMTRGIAMLIILFYGALRIASLSAFGWDYISILKIAASSIVMFFLVWLVASSIASIFFILSIPLGLLIFLICLRFLHVFDEGDLMLMVKLFQDNRLRIFLPLLRWLR